MVQVVPPESPTTMFGSTKAAAANAIAFFAPSLRFARLRNASP